MNMVKRPAIAICLVAVALAVHADSDSLTQVGSYICQGGSDIPQCPGVTFPVEFGDTPKVILSFGSINTTTVSKLNPNALNLQVALTNVSPQGFGSLLSTYPSAGWVRGPVNLNWIAVGSKQYHGNVVPNYIVLTVIYAPPGTNGGHSSSSVSYQAGSTTGTLTSASQSFKTANSLTFEGSGGFLGNGGGAGLSFDVSHSATDSQSLEIKKSATSTINRTGPSQDGVNHDEDAIYLLLNPTVNLALSSSSASWLLANSLSPIQYVYVGWLNGHMAMPAPIATSLANAGITAGEYADILARDPLANGSTVPDPSRFVSLNTTFPYEPPYSAADPVPTITTTISDTSTVTTGTATEDMYKVGLSMSATGGFLDFAKATLKDTQSWGWTNRSSTSNTTSGSQSASVTIGGPAYGYNGPTVMKVYIDTLYKSFAFALVPANSQEVAVKGTLTDTAGKPIAAAEVTLQEGAAKYRTFTNSKGGYAFFGQIIGPATITGGGVSRELPQSTATIRELRIKQ